MRLSYDFFGAQGEYARRGIGRYTVSLGKALQQECVSSDDELQGLVYAALPESVSNIEKIFKDVDLKYIFTPPRPRLQVREYDALRWAGAELLIDAYQQLSTDVICLSSPIEDNWGRMDRPRDYKLSGKFVAGVVYDFIPWVFADNPLERRPARWYKFNEERLRSCDLLLAISEATRQDAIRYLHISPEKVVNIGSGVSETFCRLQCVNHERLRKFGIVRDFVMYTGGFCWYKNIEGLITGWAHVPDEVRETRQLVVVCSLGRGQKEKFLRLAAGNGLREDEVVLTGYIPDEELVELYNTCELFVFPSFYEGFGLPVVEAMRCGAVVMGADNSSIREIIGLPEALFDAGDVTDIAAAIERGLTDHGLRRRLKDWGIKRGQAFTWRQSAERVLSSIRERFGHAKEYIASSQSEAEKQERFIRAVCSAITDYPCTEEEYLCIARCYELNHARQDLLKNLIMLPASATGWSLS